MSVNSGTQARRYEDAKLEEDGLGDVGDGAEFFCWMSATKPGMLSLTEGVGCT